MSDNNATDEAPASVHRSHVGKYLGQFRPRFSRLHEDQDLYWVVPFHVDYFVGVVGPRFAGKKTVMNYLAQRHGFRTYSLSDVLRRHATERGISWGSRSAMQDFGDELRFDLRDPGFLMRETIREIRQDHLSRRDTGRPIRVAVGGFKNQEEFALFQKLQRIEILGVSADEKTRFDRASRTGILERELAAVEQRDGQEAGTLPRDENSFRRYLDERDWKGARSRTKGGTEYGQAVGKIIRAATTHARASGLGAILGNDGDLRTLFEEIDRHVATFERRYRENHL